MASQNTLQYVLIMEQFWTVKLLCRLTPGEGPHIISSLPVARTRSNGPSVHPPERFKNLNMTQFYLDTLPDIYLPFCEYHRCVAHSDPSRSQMNLREPCNRKNEWKFKFTFYGFCLEFNNDTDSDILKKISVGRQTSLRNDTSLFKYSYGYFSGHIIWSI